MAKMHSENAKRLDEALLRAKRALMEAAQVAGTDANGGARLTKALDRLAGECEWQQQQLRKKAAA